MTKFAHLKEFLIPDIQKLIDSLPFTTEGYTRAKSILSDKFGKPVIVANAHIKYITSLQIRFQSNSKYWKVSIPILYMIFMISCLLVSKLLVPEKRLEK